MPAPILAALDHARADARPLDQVRVLRADGLQRGLWRFRLVSGGPR